ncbi:MAG: DNA repair protein RecO [Bacilli bacterium]|jgi:DNA repair protein RecO (recombination protein O)|nr:DNA repair protein RecO [Bacilli bacterium]
MNKPLVKEGYILSANKYGDSDALVTFFSKEGKDTIKVRSGYDMKSKNHQAVLVFNKVSLDLSLSLDGKYLTATGTTTLINYTSLYQDLKLSLAGQFAIELLVKYFQDRDELPYDLFETYMASIASGFDILTSALIFQAGVIKALGYAPDITACVDCGKKTNLVAFSLTEGGFICQECAEELNLPPDTSDYLKVMRYIFMVNNAAFRHAVLPKGPSFRALEELSLYIQDQLGLEVKSYKMLSAELKKSI